MTTLDGLDHAERSGTCDRRVAAREPGLAATSAVILAGGLGTRLRSVLPDRPKVLAEVDGVPFVFRLLAQLAGAGVRHVVLCTGWLGDQVRDVVGTSHHGLAIEYSQEPEPAGTAGALRRAVPLLPSPCALVLNGDSYCDVDLAQFWVWHHQRPAHASLALARVPDARRFGTVELGEYGQILRFTEKSPVRAPGLVNAGVYLVRRSLLASIEPGRALSLERDVLPRWIETGLYGYARATRFIDIGTPSSLARAGRFFRGPRAGRAGDGARRAPHASGRLARWHAEVA
jgi:NDP-sugar pyrophosphorylase family protein